MHAEHVKTAGTLSVLQMSASLDPAAGGRECVKTSALNIQKASGNMKSYADLSQYQSARCWQQTQSLKCDC